MSIKILHTADWHLGKRLYRHDLTDDHGCFLEWLASRIETQQIDVLLVSGDVFDTTNPNDGSMRLYYSFLTRMLASGCQLVITAGNHDSPQKLNAPRDLLKRLAIFLVGQASPIATDDLIRLTVKGQDMVIAAIPFLRDSDLRRATAGLSAHDRITEIRIGIRNRYQQVIDYCQTAYAQVPALAMGHLYMNGSTISDSEREIHSIGGQAAFSSDLFPDGFNYVALGHIHLPQRIGQQDTVRYSGSPIALSFSERATQHQVLEITIDNGQVTGVESVGIPMFRSLTQVSGTIEQAAHLLENLNTDGPLPPLVELLVEEPQPSHALRQQFEKLQLDYAKAPFRIAKARLTFQQKPQQLDAFYQTDTYLQDLSVVDVFQKRLRTSALPDDRQALLLETYRHLCQSVIEPS